MANKENIRKWVDALRSGEFQQTTEKLSDGQRYCCLGVACEVAIKSGIRVNKGDPVCGEIQYDETTGELPRKVAEWLGFEEEDDGYTHYESDPVLIGPSGKRFTAIEWNDKEKLPFAEIAELIEQNYLRVLG